ncbi:Ger(x)C family spore germination C-terminal domain-containing protein [Paenibacillus ehimensis]|uniref:Ger(x)C family spore germination C-terminal domain-containing protein n=1 Tax=Paenibacillus ehimensis TaxID=79264 RepID=UPI002DB801E5|nr:Ger(x)C family spore germination C-terminal domain-containing protein [Paenibacillus ehimensis]MEC0213288.1 Ger(x)C family spore germination C-terminal domain-containing protein [Paenibacillus ehimensis]
MNLKRILMIRAISLPLAAACLLPVAGCVRLADAGPSAWQAEEAQLVAAGIDEGPGGLRVTTGYGPAASGRPLQPYSNAGPRLQSFVSFQAAAYRWERHRPPELVAIGEAWARSHGFPASWTRQIRMLGVKQGRRPHVAVVEGTAERFVSSPETMTGGIARLREGGWTADPLRYAGSAYEDDVVLPYLPAGSAAKDNNSSPSGVSTRALLFKKQELVAELTSSQSNLLACMMGGYGLPKLEWSSAETPFATDSPLLRNITCRAEIASNGDLKQPRLNLVMRVAASPGGPSVSADHWASNLQRQGTELIRLLQGLRSDPLRLGESVRQQYPGVWNQDRWRDALTRARIDLQVRVTFDGGA